jgi:formimidoylglutamase
VVLLGVCNELGVRANGGRPGAAKGPAAFRRALDSLSSAGLQGHRLWDAGEVPADAPYETFFQVTEAVVASCLARGARTIVVGGGHDCSYGTYLGIVASGLGKPAVVSVDAHLDLRPTHDPSSGNPFYRMLEQGLPGPDLVEVGLIPFVNQSDHRHYGVAKGARLHDLTPGGESVLLEVIQHALDGFHAAGRQVLATVDLDAIGAPWAPGVSAVNPWGLSADTALSAVGQFAACPAVTCLDLMELAPELDPDGRTARLAAFLAAAFIAGPSGGGL